MVFLEKINKFSVGIAFGIIAPFIMLLAIYYTNYSDETFRIFILVVFQRDVFFKILPAMVFINLGALYLVTMKDKYKCSKGILFSTFMYLVFGIVMRFVL